MKTAKINKGTLAGIRFFLVHMCVEIICFMTFRHYYSVVTAGSIAFAVDVFAFVPQGLFGEFMNRHRRWPIGSVGVLMMAIGVCLAGGEMLAVRVSGFIIMALGNAILHEQGALETVAKGEGKIFPAAIFVSGGSFGVVIGQTLGKMGYSLWWLIIPLIAIEVLLLSSDGVEETAVYPEYNCVRCGNKALESSGFPIGLIIIVAAVVTAVRSYIGYAVPISWKKEIWQDFLLFFVMGLGKAFGGWLVDRFGARRIGVISTIISIPFLIVGDNNMVISVIGVCFFSMTMCITFEMILSVLPQFPGMAFGITTIALFIGISPVFFVSFGTLVNSIIVVVLSILCSVILYFFCNNKRTIE